MSSLVPLPCSSLGVDHEVSGHHPAEQERPLHADWEASTAVTARARVVNLLDDYYWSPSTFEAAKFCPGATRRYEPRELTPGLRTAGDQTGVPSAVLVVGSWPSSASRR